MRDRSQESKDGAISTSVMRFSSGARRKKPSVPSGAGGCGEVASSSRPESPRRPLDAELGNAARKPLQLLVALFRVSVQTA